MSGMSQEKQMDTRQHVNHTKFQIELASKLFSDTTQVKMTEERALTQLDDILYMIDPMNTKIIKNIKLTMSL